MTKYTVDYDNYDFRPAEPGWNVWCCWLDDTGTPRLDRQPLAGWLIQVELQPPRVEPAVWQGSALWPVVELGRSRHAVYDVTGPGQPEPDLAHMAARDERMVERARSKVAHTAARAKAAERTAR